MQFSEAGFAGILDELKNTGRLQGGFLQKAQVLESFEGYELTESQLDMVYDYLKEQKIGIDSPLEEAEYLDESESDLLKQYRRELKNQALISEGRKEALVMAAMNHDSSAYAELTGYYLPKVLEIAKLYTGQGVFLEDLIGEGNLALAEGVTMLGALEEPSEADGMLIKLIMDAMEGIVEETFTEHNKDLKLADQANTVLNKSRELSEELGRKVTIEELSENCGLTKGAIMKALRVSASGIEYIEAPEGENDV